LLFRLVYGILVVIIRLQETFMADSSTGARRFATTRWSVVLAAGRDSVDNDTAHALSELCRIYWSPLHAFARFQGCSPQDAEDHVQGFLADLLVRKDLSEVSPERGRFRSFLRAAFKNYLLNRLEHQRAQKRGGGQEFVPFETAQVEAWLVDEHAPSPEAVFDRRWAMQVLAEALTRLRRESEAGGKGKLFDDIKGCLTDEPTASYAEIAARHGCSEGAIKVAVHRLRRRYQGLLREVIAETVEQPVDIDAELNDLRSALGE